MRNLKVILSIGLILIITFIAFFPCLKNGFINWDDDRYVTENTIVQNLSLESVRQVFASFFVGNYQPLTMLSYLIDYRFSKLNPLGYHLTNLILHLLNSLLVFWLIYILTRKISVSLITAVLFGIHPLHVESVAWISERKDLLYALFFLGAIISYLLYLKKENKQRYYYMSIFLFLLSLLSKSMAITLPLVLFLIDYFVKRKPNKTSLLDKIPFFILSFIFGIIAILGQVSSGAVRGEGIVSFLNKIAIAGYGIVFYINKLLLPVKLSCAYPYFEIKNIFLFLYPLIIFIIFLVAVILSTRYTKKFIFGGALFLITIMPVLQFIPIGETVVADRYIYIASIGIFYIVGEGIFWLFTNKIRHLRLAQAFTLILLVMIAVVLASLTWQRCQVWKDNIALWSDVLNKYPNVATAYNSRGAEYLVKKDYANAYADFMSTLNIDQKYYEAYFNLGSLYSSKGNYNEAAKFINKTLEINPTYLKAYDLLTAIYGRTGKHSEVIRICKRAIQIKHDYIPAYINLCSAYGNLGDFQEAIVYGEKAIAIDPKSALANMNLSIAYFYAKKYDLAIKHCDMAIALGHKVCPKFLEDLKKASRHQN